MCKITSLILTVVLGVVCSGRDVKGGRRNNNNGLMQGNFLHDLGDAFGHADVDSTVGINDLGFSGTDTFVDQPRNLRRQGTGLNNNIGSNNKGHSLGTVRPIRTSFDNGALTGSFNRGNQQLGTRRTGDFSNANLVHPVTFRKQRQGISPDLNTNFGSSGQRGEFDKLNGFSTGNNVDTLPKSVITSSIPFTNNRRPNGINSANSNTLTNNIQRNDFGRKGTFSPDRSTGFGNSGNNIIGTNGGGLHDGRQTSQFGRTRKNMPFDNTNVNFNNGRVGNALPTSGGVVSGLSRGTGNNIIFNSNSQPLGLRRSGQLGSGQPGFDSAIDSQRFGTSGRSNYGNTQTRIGNSVLPRNNQLGFSSASQGLDFGNGGQRRHDSRRQNGFSNNNIQPIGLQNNIPFSNQAPGNNQRAGFGNQQHGTSNGFGNQPATGLVNIGQSQGISTLPLQGTGHSGQQTGFNSLNQPRIVSSRFNSQQPIGISAVGQPQIFSRQQGYGNRRQSNGLNQRIGTRTGLNNQGFGLEGTAGISSTGQQGHGNRNSLGGSQNRDGFSNQPTGFGNAVQSLSGQQGFGSVGQSRGVLLTGQQRFGNVGQTHGVSGTGQQGFGSVGQSRGVLSTGQQQGFGNVGQTHGVSGTGQQGFGSVGQTRGVSGTGQQGFGNVGQTHGVSGTGQGFGSVGQSRGVLSTGQQQGFGNVGQTHGVSGTGQQGFGNVGQTHGVSGTGQGFRNVGQSRGVLSTGQQGFGNVGQTRGVSGTGQQGFGNVGQTRGVSGTAQQGFGNVGQTHGVSGTGQGFGTVGQSRGVLLTGQQGFGNVGQTRGVSGTGQQGFGNVGQTHGVSGTGQQGFGNVGQTHGVSGTGQQGFGNIGQSHGASLTGQQGFINVPQPRGGQRFAGQGTGLGRISNPGFNSGQGGYRNNNGQTAFDNTNQALNRRQLHNNSGQRNGFGNQVRPVSSQRGYSNGQQNGFRSVSRPRGISTSGQNSYDGNNRLSGF